MDAISSLVESLCMDAISSLVEKLHEKATNWKLNAAFCKR